jgi:hypothetical protein
MERIPRDEQDDDDEARHPWADLTTEHDWNDTMETGSHTGSKGSGKRTFEHEHGTSSKGHGKQKGNFMDQAFFDVLDRHREFSREVQRYVAGEGLTKIEYVLTWADVEQEYRYWNSRQAPERRPDYDNEVRIKEEWTECILRQLLLLKEGNFRNREWRRFDKHFVLSHGGHMLHPTHRVMIWGAKGSPKPSNPVELDGTRDTMKTFGANKRHYGNDDDDDAPREQTNKRDQGAAFPPQSLKVPPIFYMYKKTVGENLCYVCEGYNHHGFRCECLMAYFHLVPEGQEFLAAQGLSIPTEMVYAIAMYIETFKVIYEELKYPARLACILVRRWLTKDLPVTALRDFGEFADKAEMAKEAGYPKFWEGLAWQRIYEMAMVRRSAAAAASTSRPKYPPPPLDPVAPKATQQEPRREVPKPKPSVPEQFNTRPGYKAPAPTFEETKDDKEFAMAD